MQISAGLYMTLVQHLNANQLLKILVLHMILTPIWVCMTITLLGYMPTFCWCPCQPAAYVVNRLCPIFNDG